MLENFETIQQARNRKPRPLSFIKIAKIISENGLRVSAQLVKSVCKEHEALRKKGGVVALDGAATDLDRSAAKQGGAVSLDGTPANRPKRKKVTS